MDENWMRVGRELDKSWMRGVGQDLGKSWMRVGQESEKEGLMPNLNTFASVNLGGKNN